MIEKIKEEKEEDDMEVVEKANALMDDDDLHVAKQALGDIEKIRTASKRIVLIHSQEGPGGDQSVFVAVNGMGYNIPRNIPVPLPEPVIAALDNAVEIHYSREQLDGKDSFGPVIERKVRRFPYSIQEKGGR